MVLDTSAVVAILFDEPARRGEPAGRELDLLMHRACVDTVSVTADHVEIARRAWRRYGKGRHAAALNFGDCFAYALARSSGEALLHVGEDFARTDITRIRVAGETSTQC